VAFDILIKNGTIVSRGACKQADVAISGRKIVEIGALGDARATKIIDAQGLSVLPGVIDTQVHFREPGNEHKENIESGSHSALLGGVTSFFDMPNTKPSTSSQEAFEDKLRRAEGRSWCNYAFYIGATPENVEDLPRLEQLPGCAGIKIFMGSSTGSLLIDDEAVLEQVLESGHRRCSVHSEDEHRLRSRKPAFADNPDSRNHPVWRDVDTAVISTTRLISLAKRTKRKVHLLHVSTADELRLVSEAKERGVDITCEATPQHLWFFAPDCYESLGTLAQMNPPIRDSWHQMALRQAVSDGLVDMMGSDHAPHTLEEKAIPYPNSPSGMPGVQTLLPVMLQLHHDGLIGLADVVRLLCENPARLFGISDKGIIGKGYDADITIVDLNESRIFERNMVASKCGWSPFEGECITGWPKHVIVNGKLMLYNGEIQGTPNGRMLDFDDVGT
jgi:dihydroorotase